MPQRAPTVAREAADATLGVAPRSADTGVRSPAVNLTDPGLTPAQERHVTTRADSIDVDIDVTDDGTWSATWMWTCSGDETTDDVHEELLLMRSEGLVFDFLQEPHHPAEPGQTYIGSGLGRVPVPPGQVSWSFRVIDRSGYIAMRDGSFFAATNPDLGTEGSPEPEVTPRPSGGGTGGRRPATGETEEPTLRRRDDNPDGWVEYLQTLLNGYGYGLDVDGDFGRLTDEAVRDFQTARHLKVDGIVGNQTWSALRGEAPQSPGTDGRAPHSYRERGCEARWYHEVTALQYDVDQDALALAAFSTGDTPIPPGRFSAQATVTVPDGRSVTVDLASTTNDGAPAGPGEWLWFGGSGLHRALGDGPYTVTAVLPDELGGDRFHGTIASA